MSVTGVKLAAVPAAAMGVLMAGISPNPAAADHSPPPVQVPNAAGGWVDPVPGATLTQGFGCTALELEPIAFDCPGGHFHAGIDLAAPAGTGVRATADGVADVAFNPGGYGLRVVLDHGHGLATLYGHLSASALRGGELVEAGEEVGKIGSSGLSTGPHLHFEVRRDGRPVEPAGYLPTLTKKGERRWSTK